jgi:hypothetical protein
MFHVEQFLGKERGVFHVEQLGLALDASQYLSKAFNHPFNLLRGMRSRDEYSKHSSILSSTPCRNSINKDAPLEERFLHGARFKETFKPHTQDRQLCASKHPPPLGTQRCINDPRARRKPLSLRNGDLN